jgi:hypothetical protein
VDISWALPIGDGGGCPTRYYILSLFNDILDQNPSGAPFTVTNTSTAKIAGKRASARVEVPQNMSALWNHNTYGGMLAHVNVRACSIAGCSEKSSINFMHNNKKHGLHLTWLAAGVAIGALCLLSVVLLVFAKRQRRGAKARARALNESLLQKRDARDIGVADEAPELIHAAPAAAGAV